MKASLDSIVIVFAALVFAASLKSLATRKWRRWQRTNDLMMRARARRRANNALWHKQTSTGRAR